MIWKRYCDFDANKHQFVRFVLLMITKCIKVDHQELIWSNFFTMNTFFFYLITAICYILSVQAKVIHHQYCIVGSGPGGEWKFNPAINVHGLSWIIIWLSIFAMDFTLSNFIRVTNGFFHEKSKSWLHRFWKKWHIRFEIWLIVSKIVFL